MDGFENFVRVVIWVSVLADAAVRGKNLDENFQTLCSQRCPFQNSTENHFDIGCGNECKIGQCFKGCRLWRKALESSCQAVCNGTQNMLSQKELHCVIGCNDAVNQYFQKLKDDIGTPPAPYLVADTLTATSLRLAWEGARYSEISYLVQWRYEEHAGAWQYCRNQSWGSSSVISVEDLQPYTKYRFRVALLLSPHSEPIVSEPSVVISTLAAGTPSSPPILIRATAVDSKRISVSWKPGPFPNGPIHSYVLVLEGGFVAIKEDIPAAKTADFYMFQNLSPNSKYLISISMRNAVGEGPSATAEISTPPEPTVKDALQPILILGSNHRVIKQGADMMLEAPLVIYETSSTITGVGIHVRQNLLFVSDSDGYVSATSLKEFGKFKHLLTPYDMSFKPFDLSVDWLNEHLYVLGEIIHNNANFWQVARSTLDGKGLTVAVAGITNRPLHVEVDPYNGYLFWLIQGPNRGGLYRLDLANISNGIKHEVVPDVILENPYLGAFVVDHVNFCILIPNQKKNTVYSVSLDGREVVDLRSNTQQPLFQNVLSLAVANGLFYWTDGEEVLAEDYHEEYHTYFHNHYLGSKNRSYISVHVDLPTSQPIPVPVNPPIQVQAVLGGHLAKISWQTPHIVGGQGKGAWQNWSYEVQIKSLKTNIVRTLRDINNTFFTVEGLEEDTEYIIKAAAYTSSGNGPWSSEFKGKTIKTSKNGNFPSLLWSAAEGLLESDVTGEELEILISQENLKEGNSNYHFTDVSWYRDMLFLVSNTSKAYWYNLTNREYGQFHHLDSVGSIAVDWMGKKLYWSNPKQQLIIRGDLKGRSPEPLLILTIAKELTIDSEQAYIYWSTGHAVECATLNGDDRRVYYPAELFSGKQVMGLALNMDDRHVYWIVRSNEGSNLYKAPMLQLGDTTPKEPEVTRISRLLYANMQGPMCYFSDHLLWLQDNRNAVIADLFGKNVALLSGLSLSSLNMVSVRDINLQDFQDNERFVIPEPIDESSISITGTSSSFNITWKPVTNVNYGKVFYDVKTEDYSKESFAKTDLNELVYERGKDLLPYTKIKVTLQAYTYWGSSPRVVKVIRSPPSPPGKPSNPRVFLTSHRNLKNEDIRVVALLRWDHPKEPNGLITAYKVKYSAVSQDADQFFEINLKPDTLEVELENLQINATYYFQIKASTLAGEGNFTEPIYTNTSVEVPVPMILAATEDSIQIIDCDRDTHKTLSSGDKPVDIALNSHEGWLYWLNDMQEIVGMSLDGTSKTKMHIMNGTGLTMAIDWIGRFLYWSEADDINETESTCTVYRIDLTQLENGITHVDKILVRTGRIQDLKISPFTNTLYWIETNQDGERHLMQSQTDGSGIRPFLSKQAGNSGRQCACAENPKVGKTMAVDLSDPYHVSVIYSDERRGRLYSAESSGCRCKLIVRSLSSPPTSLAADRENVFWSDETKNAIFFLKRDSEIRAFTLQGVKRIFAAGLHLQPYPPTRCLLVKQYNETPSLVDHGATSITLSLPRPERDSDCRNISTPSMQYVVYFDQLTESGHSECANSISSCKSIVTYDRVVKINNLKPFSSYVFIVSVRNYLGNLESGPIISSPAVFDTLAGAPPAPLNVTATVLTPIAVEVQWFTSENSKDKTISYQVHWRTEGLIGGVRQSGEQIVESAGNRISQKVIVSRLMPGQIYLIWVRACSKLSPTYSDSKRVEVRTFDQPHNITLAKATPYALEIDWEPPEDLNCEFNIEFRQFSDAEPWEKIKNSNEKNGDHYIINNLLPKTFYKFRIAITYVESKQTYIWPLEGFGFETLGDRPGRPGTPVIQELRKDVYQVLWTKSRENGAAIDYYALEGFVKKIWRRKRETDYNSSLENRAPFEQWNLYYNGTENYWIISNLSPNLKHVFRVKAKNKFGWSDFSERSKSFDFAEAAMLADQEEFGVVLGTAVPLLFLCCVVIFIIFCCVTKIRDKEKKELQILTLTPTNRGPDVELATLRELPRRANFIQNANVLYGTSSGFPFDEEIALLPHIRREQFKLTKFLGSGAFGEVYEGIAQGLPRTGNGTRVAIKALRKGATENEKAEFLREAQLMSHFKHEHILQLLGVCLDNDPNYILMELMEGGDLLSYLRMNRPLIKTNNALKLQDLLEMCLDVTKGCRYLEEMHFVHRDLACRNCLVSSKDPRTRIVKIGDFGLARDIYKNDYYRKEGEGLLPVRWMAPESLVDGVFTSQSDVWAFGVLIWEIMTLGQQPYPARTNLEVLHYVRGGGRLGRPINCSEELHQLMMKCWSFNPEHRPTFKYCLDTLRNLKQQSTNSLLTPDFCGNYVEARIRRSEDEDDGHENDGFCGSENDSDLALNKPESNCDTDDESSGAVTVISQEPHQYLELLYEDQMPESDGYEIPRFSCRKADERRDQETTSDQGKEEESHESYSENLDFPKKLVSNSVAPSAS